MGRRARSCRCGHAWATPGPRSQSHLLHGGTAGHGPGDTYDARRIGCGRGRHPDRGVHRVLTSTKDDGRLRCHRPGSIVSARRRRLTEDQVSAELVGVRTARHPCLPAHRGAAWAVRTWERARTSGGASRAPRSAGVPSRDLRRCVRPRRTGRRRACPSNTDVHTRGSGGPRRASAGSVLPAILTEFRFLSLCKHHALPYFGEAWVGYVAHEGIIGISKLTRLVRVVTRRFGVQEEMTHEIADELTRMMEPHGVAVYLEAHHLCTQMRGVRELMAKTRTTAFRGNYSGSASLRSEFFDVAGLRRPS